MLGQFPDVTKKPHGQARRNYNIQEAAGIDPGVYKVMKVHSSLLDVFSPNELLTTLQERHPPLVPQASRYGLIPYIPATTPNEQAEA